MRTYMTQEEREMARQLWRRLHDDPGYTEFNVGFIYTLYHRSRSPDPVFITDRQRDWLTNLYRDGRARDMIVALDRHEAREAFLETIEVMNERILALEAQLDPSITW